MRYNDDQIHLVNAAFKNYDWVLGEITTILQPSIPVSRMLKPYGSEVKNERWNFLLDSGMNYIWKTF